MVLSVGATPKNLDERKAEGEASLRDKLLERLNRLHRSVKKSSKLRKSGAPMSLLEYFVCSIEVAVGALPDPKALGKALAAGANILVGAGKAIFMANPGQLLQGLCDLADSAMVEARRMYNEHQWRQLSFYTVRPHKPQCITVHDAVELWSTLSTESYRWEVQSGFVLMLTDTIVSLAESMVVTSGEGGDEPRETLLVELLEGTPDFPGLLGIASFGAPDSVNEQDVHSIALQVTEWASRLVTSGDDMDMGEWLKEGLELLSGRIQTALTDFVQSKAVTDQLDWFARLIAEVVDAAAKEGASAAASAAKRLGSKVDELLPVVTMVAKKLDEGSKACDQPIMLLDQVQSLLSSFASLNPMSLAIGQITKLADMAQVQLSAAIREPLDEAVIGLLEQADLDAAEGMFDFRSLQGVTTMLEACASKVLDWANATNLSMSTAQHVLESLHEDDEIKRTGLLVVTQVQQVVGWAEVVAAAVREHVKTVQDHIEAAARAFEVVQDAITGPVQKEKVAEIRQVVLEKTMSLTINGTTHEVSLQGLPTLLTDLGEKQLTEVLHQVKSLVLPGTDETGLPQEVLDFQRNIAAVAAHVDTMRGVLHQVQENAALVKEKLQADVVERVRHVKAALDVVKTEARKASQTGTRSLLSSKKAGKVAYSMRATLSKAKLPSVERTDVITQQLKELIKNLQDILRQGVAFIRCNAPQFDFALPSFLRAELRNMKALQQALDQLQDQAISELKGLADQTIDQMADAMGDVLGGEEMGSVLSVASEVVGGVMDEWTARESPWHVRSVAVFCMQRLAVLEPLSQQLREPIQRALVRRQVCETHSSVLQLLKAHSEMAKETNEVLCFSRSAAETMGEAPPSEVQQAVEKSEKRLVAIQEQMQQMQQLVMAHVPDPLMHAAFVAEEEIIAHQVSVRMQALEAKRDEIDNTSDPAEKQVLILMCRMEQQDLSAMAKNVSNVSKKLDIVVDFLSDLQSGLTRIDGKLDALQAQISSLHENFRQLTGRPVLDVMREKAEHKLQDIQSRLPDKVYIEPEVCGPGPKNNFEADENENPAKPVSKAIQRFLTGNKNVALLSGRAGSGKSTAMQESELHILGPYAQHRKEEEGIIVVLLKVKLTALNDPLGGVFEEGCKQQGLRQTQIDELREKVQEPNSKIELVFILDGYDELPPAIVSKNLWR